MAEPLEMVDGVVCVRGNACRLVRLKPINWDDPWVRWQAQQFAQAYQAALRAGRDPGKDSEVLRLLHLVTEGNGQPQLPGFDLVG